MQKNRSHLWDEEYKKPKLITKSRKPQRDFLTFLRWIKNNKHIDLYSGIRILDLGCGIGRNAYYLARVYDAQVFAWDFSSEAIKLAIKYFSHPSVFYEKRNIADLYPIEDESIDIIIDIMSSHTLSEKERKIYLKETHRVLKKGGYFYLRTFAKEGDKNAKNLIKKFPGKEKDTYIHPELHITERIFSGPELKKIYAPYFRSVRMLRKSAYQIFGKQAYKRNYWNVYFTKEK